MYNQIAFQLKMVRKNNKLTQKEFAHLIETTTRSLGRYEMGTHRVTLYGLYKTNQLFHTDWSLWISDEKEENTIHYTFPDTLIQQTTDKDSFYQTLGKRITYLRKLNRLSQRELSEQLGLTDRALAHYERGNRCIHLEDLITLSKLLNVTPHELLYNL